LRIIHITFSLKNAGKENMLVDLANEQNSLGHDIAIIVINDSLDVRLVNRIGKNIHVFRLNRNNRSKNILHLLKLLYILNIRFRADVIHSHDPQLGFLLKFTNFIPFLLTVHGPAFDTSNMRYYKKLIAVSQSVKLDIERRSTNKCDIIYNGIRINSIKKHESVSRLDEFNVISVGRLDHLVKGQDLLIKAANDLVNVKGLQNVKFFIVGEGSSRNFLEELILELKLSENVFLLGNKNREWIYENLYRYDLFIQPSRLEGFGLTVTEAMAAKVPVLASDIEGPAEILENGKHGMLFENNNSEDLALKIRNAIHLIENEEIINMIDSAYNHCLNNFNITRTAQEYCNAYL
jgi:glycosyltransferase involved in cell wall biosynthesis